MGKFDIDNILKLDKLNNELDLEQANSLYSRLRPLVKEDPSLKSVRKHLADLIEAYEEKHWSDDEAITDEQVEAHDFAERIVQFQNLFA
jgi:exonuclease VII small subunit